MVGLYLLLPTLLVIFFSFLVVRAAAVLLMFTGLDERTARFQALSAFTRTGFTTSETELIMKNPRRRRIVTWLIILGNAGLVTVIVTATSSLSLTSTSPNGAWLGIDVTILAIGIVLVYLVARHTPMASIWERFVKNHMSPSDVIEEAPFHELLHVSDGYALRRIFIPQGSDLIGKPIDKIHDTDGLLVMGIERGKKWLPLPDTDETIEIGDSLVTYGELKRMKKAFLRATP